MDRNKSKIKKKDDREVYVLIDVSNIRSACLKSCDFNIDFIRLYEYLKRKYVSLKDVRYYEGISCDDKSKEKKFKLLEECGYSIRSLRRRSYIEPASTKTFACKKCKCKNRVQIHKKEVKMKSNVDVFLASEMLEIAYEAKKPTHIIVFTCDGDYAEAIRIAAKNSKISITVIATPPMVGKWKKNSLSVRLRELRKNTPRYQLNNINDIKDEIKQLRK
ncbi:NYN domain-containing protein [Candidatus Saccharibacteria bacterium]|nr:NYN domain-containing protein [Candidatus Saccharibacteria bacterium]